MLKQWSTGLPVALSIPPQRSLHTLEERWQLSFGNGISLHTPEISQVLLNPSSCDESAYAEAVVDRPASSLSALARRRLHTLGECWQLSFGDRIRLRTAA